MQKIFQMVNAFYQLTKQGGVIKAPPRMLKEINQWATEKITKAYLTKNFKTNNVWQFHFDFKDLPQNYYPRILNNDFSRRRNCLSVEIHYQTNLEKLGVWNVNTVCIDLFVDINQNLEDSLLTTKDTIEHELQHFMQDVINNNFFQKEKNYFIFEETSRKLDEKYRHLKPDDINEQRYQKDLRFLRPAEFDTNLNDCQKDFLDYQFPDKESFNIYVGNPKVDPNLTDDFFRTLHHYDLYIWKKAVVQLWKLLAPYMEE